MKTKAAVAYEFGKPLEIVELNLEGPKEGEVLIQYTHAGLCHSDLHALQGDMPGRLPMVLGHEGAGIIREIGPGVTRMKVGDHVVCSFVPACGVCRWCATGQQAICDMGANILNGFLPGGRYPLTGPGKEKDYAAMCMLGTFSQYGTIHQSSCVKVADDLPLDKAVLVGCGVPTGWGSAVNSANVRPGETVIVLGIGGVGVNAVQGARFAGAKHLIAIDPLPNKREKAMEFGATHAFATAEEAIAFAQSVTNGNGADKVIVTPGTVTEQIVTDAVTACGKGGTVVLTGLSNFVPNTAISGTLLTLFKKTIKGSLFGDCNPTVDIPRLLGLYQSGDLKLDELVTRTYTLEQVNQGYEDLIAGKNIRGVIVHDAL